MDAWRFVAIVACFVLSLFFTLVSTTGVLRLPDVYSRAHTASQADTLGAGFALAGVAIALGVTSTAFKTVLLLFFIFVTNPTAAHAIARAADEEGIEHWTVDDDRTDDDLVDRAGDGPAIGASIEVLGTDEMIGGGTTINGESVEGDDDTDDRTGDTVGRAGDSDDRGGDAVDRTDGVDDRADSAREDADGETNGGGA